MKKSRIITAMLLVLFALAVVFVTSPNINPLYPDGLSFWAFFITLSGLVLWAGESILRALHNAGRDEFGARRFRAPRRGWLWGIAMAAPWVILIAVGIYSSVLFHSKAYRDQMPAPEERKFTSDIQPLDLGQLPVVDHDLAALLADKKLGEKPALGSIVTLGDPTIQKVDGKLVWVVPLEHSGFFKWVSNMSGTPGYIVVSATDPRDVTYVDTYKIKYQPNAYLLDNLKRHARFSGGLFTGLTDYTFEIDDSGRPYWVVTTYKNRVGFALPEADGILLVDAATGRTKRYALGDVPSWIERVQPTDFITTQLNNRGKYIHGIFNFSNKDKFETSEGYAIVYNNNRCYYFTGLTSIGTDESATGFVMVDMVTKKPYLYDMPGATEYAAQTSAEGKVQHLKYTASFPLITNVDGRPTYFMTLKDAAGLIKQYAFVSVSDYTTVGTGETIADALNDFRKNLSNHTTGSDIDTGTIKQTLTGSVLRISAEEQSGSTVYKFILAEKPDKIFTATYSISEKLALTREGDRVKIEYLDSARSVIAVTAFDNLSVTPAGGGQ